ncbi:aldehyde ferredoxin oxidoreductase family protein [Thermodesulfobacteriota bacterium]
MYGLMGKILRVNLTEGSIAEEKIGQEDARKFVGGVGLASKYLYDEVPKGADPLGPENKLIFMTGPLTGTACPSAGRYSVVSKSPLTGAWAQANSGGFWAVDFKKSGYDGIIFEGASAKPVYLVCTDEKVELRDAAGLWGLKVPETTTAIQQELGEQYKVACIGPAGEKQGLMACIMNDVHRAAGRCGLGAVMGSKNLKAIAVRGSRTVEIAEPQQFRDVSKKQYQLIGDSMLKVGLETHGTNLLLDMVNVRGGLPTRNFQEGMFEPVEKVNGPALTENILKDRVACYACPIACGRVSKIKEGTWAGREGEGPEYESVVLLGSSCGVDDLNAITAANFLCNEYGLDTISVGGTIAFAMECYEKGLLTDADTGGLALKFGDADLLVKLTEMIALREGVGDLLSHGSRYVARKLGGGAETFAMHVKGLELPAYDSRAAKITGLGYAVASRGGDHMTGYIQGPTFIDTPFLVVDDSKIEDLYAPQPKDARVLRDLEDALTMFDVTGTCKFMGLMLDAHEWVDLIASVTGWQFDVDDFRKTGERVVNLSRAFNMREGLSRADDTLPARLLAEPMPGGPASGHMVEQLDTMLDQYYTERGWDLASGRPTSEKLQELGLGGVAADLWQ